MTEFEERIGKEIQVADVKAEITESHCEHMRSYGAGYDSGYHAGLKRALAIYRGGGGRMNKSKILFIMSLLSSTFSVLCLTAVYRGADTTFDIGGIVGFICFVVFGIAAADEA